MTEKRRPTFDLDAIKDAACRIRVTVVATRTAAGLGFGRADIEAVIRGMERRHFHKFVTSHQDHRIWQDVYYVPSAAGLLYVKFTSDAVTELLLLSFKEKDNG